MSVPTEQEIRANERERWARITLMLALNASREAMDDPRYDLVSKILIVLSKRLLDNDAPPGGDDRVLTEIVDLFNELGLAGPQV